MDAARVEELLVAIGREHHRAFLDVDGFDPEWPLWYAERLRAELGALGRESTVSELVADLVDADRAHRREAPQRPWAAFFAERLADRGS